MVNMCKDQICSLFCERVRLWRLFPTEKNESLIFLARKFANEDASGPTENGFLKRSTG